MAYVNITTYFESPTHDCIIISLTEIMQKTSEGKNFVIALK